MSFGFRASGSTPIYGMQERSQREGLRAVSEALRRLEEKKKRDRIASEKADPLRQLVATGGRIAAAYYTGGASEATGLGKKGSQAIVGKRSDGSAYDDPMGDMIEVGAGAYNMMEGMKQKDISDLKAEDIAAYNRDIAYAKSFAEGSPERKQALMTARTTLEKTQTAQDYGDRADTNPFLYTRGRKDVTIPTTIFEGDQAGGGGLPPKTDTSVVTDAEIAGKTDFEQRQLARQLDNQKALEDDRMSVRERASRTGIEGLGEQRSKAQALEEARTSAREDASRRGYKTDAAVDRQLAEAEEGMSVGKIEEDKMWDRLSNEDDIDREYDKRLATGFGREATGKTKDEYVADYLGGGQKNRQGNYADDWMTGREAYEEKLKSGELSPATPYKTYSEKEAEELSKKDREEESELDKVGKEQKFKKDYKEETTGWKGWLNDILPTTLQSEVYTTGKRLEKQRAQEGPRWDRPIEQTDIYKNALKRAKKTGGLLSI